MKKTILILGLTATAIFASTPVELLEKNCASCHLLTKPTPQIIPTLKAPAMDAVGLHLKLAIKDKEEMKKFIIDYVFNPLASKSVCESNKVQKFGTMPSQKGKVSKEDLEKIAQYVIEKYPTPQFSKMIKEIKTNGRIKGLINSPFLINQSGLPHITKILIENWDKAKLGLSDKQKEKLLIIRQETLKAVKKIKKEIAPLEESIISSLSYGEDPKKLESKVDQIASLKAKATKVHLKCISETIKVLNDEQISFLLPFSDY